MKSVVTRNCACFAVIALALLAMTVQVGLASAQSPSPSPATASSCGYDCLLYTAPYAGGNTQNYPAESGCGLGGNTVTGPTTDTSNGELTVYQQSNGDECADFADTSYAYMWSPWISFPSGTTEATWSFTIYAQWYWSTGTSCFLGFATAEDQAWFGAAVDISNGQQVGGGWQLLEPIDHTQNCYVTGAPSNGTSQGPSPDDSGTGGYQTYNFLFTSTSISASLQYEPIVELNVFTKGVGSNGAGQATVDFLNSGNMIAWDQVMVVYNTGGGGGGCVAYGTPILTPTGYVPVQNLRAGDAVEEYDLANGSMLVGNFVSGNSTAVSQVVDINNGWLSVTPTDQPVFIENASFVGWLRDPQNITTADSIFDPTTHSFVQVTSVQLVDRHTRVYDVVTSSPNNFIANGALLDIKA